MSQPSNELLLQLLEKVASLGTFRYATVAATSPLRVRFDGDVTAADATPTSLVAAALAVGDRVWCHHVNGGAITVVGRKEG